MMILLWKVHPIFFYHCSNDVYSKLNRLDIKTTKMKTSISSEALGNYNKGIWKMRVEIKKEQEKKIVKSLLSRSSYKRNLRRKVSFLS